MSCSTYSTIPTTINVHLIHALDYNIQIYDKGITILLKVKGFLFLKNFSISWWYSISKWPTEHKWPIILIGTCKFPINSLIKNQPEVLIWKIVDESSCGAVLVSRLNVSSEVLVDSLLRIDSFEKPNLSWPLWYYQIIGFFPDDFWNGISSNNRSWKSTECLV